MTGRQSGSEFRARLEAVLAPELIRALEQLVDERVADALAELAAANGDGRKWLTLGETAALLGCSVDAVRMRCKRGRLEHRRQGSRVYVSRSSVDALG